MLYEVRIAADTDKEFATTLTKIVEAIQTLPANNNQFSFSRYQDPDTLRQAANGDSVPLTPEMFAAAAKASQDNAAPSALPAKRGRPAKSTIVSDPPAATPTATIVTGPDGEPAAAMEESPFGNAPEDADPDVVLTAAQKREKAIGILQSVFADPAGPPGVRTLQTKLKVKKFSEVPDAQCDDLLHAAQELFARVKAVAA